MTNETPHFQATQRVLHCRSLRSVPPTVPPVGIGVVKNLYKIKAFTTKKVCIRLHCPWDTT